MTTVDLCAARELPAHGARGFGIVVHGTRHEILLVRLDGGPAHAFVNRCPHTGVNLDWNPGVFMDITGKLIQCATHGALFRPGDGYCISGPCAGQRLTPLELDEIEGRVRVHLPD